MLLIIDVERERVLYNIHKLLYKIDIEEVDESLFNKDSYYETSEKMKIEIRNNPELLWKKRQK